MKTNKTSPLLLSVIVLCAAAFLASAAPLPSSPEYTSDAQLKMPENYREWVYLTTGFDMSYNPGTMSMDHHMFDNVFVNPEPTQLRANGNGRTRPCSCSSFAWPEDKGSINQKGNYQGTETMGTKCT